VNGSLVQLLQNLEPIVDAFDELKIKDNNLHSTEITVTGFVRLNKCRSKRIKIRTDRGANAGAASKAYLHVI
jgi:hypothetical protein